MRRLHGVQIIHLQCRAISLSSTAMNHKAVVAAVAGIACLLGSCVPLGNATWHRWRGSPARVLPLTPTTPLSGVTLALRPARYARVAVTVALKASETPAAKPAHAVPVTLRIRDAPGRELLNASRDTQAARTHRTRASIAQAGGGHLTLHYDFPPFMAPTDGRILLDAQLAGARNDGALLEKAEIVITDDLSDDAVGVTFGVFMLLAGWIAAVVGVLTLLGNPSPPAGGQRATSGERRAAMRGHLLGLLAYPLPFVHLLVMARWWVGSRGRSAFVEEHGREALNFQLSILVYLLIAFSLSLVVIGILMLPGVLLFQIVMTIEGAVQARAGHRFRYPLTFRFLRAPRDELAVLGSESE